MVQFRSGQKLHEQYRVHEHDYWKLNANEGWSTKTLTHELDRKNDQRSIGRHFRSDKARLRYLCSRQERGLLLYDRYSPEDLKQMCKSRGVYSPHPYHQHKQAFIYALENADERGTFDKFLLLPAELRLQIYDLHIEWIRERMDCWQIENRRTIERAKYDDRFLALPPLAGVCRLIRHEVLPVLYASSGWVCKGLYSRNDPLPTAHEWYAKSFLVTLNLVQEGCFLWFKVHYLSNRADKTQHRFDAWFVKIGPRGRTRWDHCISPTAVHLWKNSRFVTNRGAVNRMEEEIQTLVTKMAQKPGGLDVQPPDLTQILAIYQRLSESYRTGP